LRAKEIAEAKEVAKKYGVSIFACGETEQKKRDKKDLEKSELQSVKSGVAKSTTSSKSKNWHKDVECNLCGKRMREDALKNHRGKKFCKAK
jgi:hypothetical protein